MIWANPARVASPTNGTYNLANSTYTPNANFSGADTLTFRVSDGVLNSTVEAVTIVVNAVNDAPVLGAVAVAGTEDTMVSFSTALFRSLIHHGRCRRTYSLSL